MNPSSDESRCDQLDVVSAYSLGALPPAQRQAAQEHIDSCRDCRQELASLRPIVDSFSAWPTAVLRPAPLWDRLVERIATESKDGARSSPLPRWTEPQWQEAAPGITFKMLSNDTERDRVSMLVRLAPGVAYPPHKHAGVEELHLLEGELWIEDRKLYPGDYNRGEPGTSDQRVWSETGCTCLLITSPSDILR